MTNLNKYSVEEKKGDDLEASSGKDKAASVATLVSWFRNPDDLGGTGHGDISYSDADPGL